MIDFKILTLPPLHYEVLEQQNKNLLCELLSKSCILNCLNFTLFTYKYVELHKKCLYYLGILLSKGNFFKNSLIYLAKKFAYEWF